MNAIEDREKALEQIYFRNSEMAFKVRSRRDRLLAVWICGMTGAAEALRERMEASNAAATQDIARQPSP
ncbi:ATPase inhibitor subunit zeta [Rhizobium hidalgonense]|uniref:ATPase inhibitor subunit zeta n=1 Tax=Rhizobium hidalgonense TaxID=1538159 RepID=UPI001106504A|nr:ATPase inhibitor subunit zeta [Rhizobium hidalgonense]QKK26848.1 DUF1476 family protein [Rhizobium hidalgonense]